MSWAKDQMKRADAAEARVKELEAQLAAMKAERDSFERSLNNLSDDQPKRRGRPRASQD